MHSIRKHVRNRGLEVKDKNGFEGKEFKFIETEKLVVDRDTYQRPFSLKRAREMSMKWNFRQCTPLDVSAREDGKYAVIDGGHRLEAAKIRGVRLLPCWVNYDLEIPDEASLFTKLNTERKSVSSTALFRSEIAAQEELYTGALALMNKYGLSVPGVGHNGDKLHQIACPASILRIVDRKGLRRLETVLGFINACWSDDPKKYQGWVFRGLSRFFDLLHEKKLSPYNSKGEFDEKLVTKMSVWPLSKIALKAAELNPLSTNSARTLGEAFRYLYNWRRQGSSRI